MHETWSRQRPIDRSHQRIPPGNWRANRKKCSYGGWQRFEYVFERNWIWHDIPRSKGEDANLRHCLCTGNKDSDRRRLRSAGGILCGLANAREGHDISASGNQEVCPSRWPDGNVMMLIQDVSVPLTLAPPWRYSERCSATSISMHLSRHFRQKHASSSSAALLGRWESTMALQAYQTRIYLGIPPDEKFR